LDMKWCIAWACKKNLIALYSTKNVIIKLEGGQIGM
jgi:hypothetical protein